MRSLVALTDGCMPAIGCPLPTTPHSRTGRRTRKASAGWFNNRAEDSHLPFRRRERAMPRFRRMQSVQTFADVHASVTNHLSEYRACTALEATRLSPTISGARSIIVMTLPPDP